MSDRLQQLFEKMDGLTADMMTAKAKVDAKREKLRMAEEEVVTRKERLKVAEARVDSTRKAIVDVVQSIKIIQDEQASSDAVPSSSVMAGTTGVKDIYTRHSYQGSVDKMTVSATASNAETPEDAQRANRGTSSRREAQQASSRGRGWGKEGIDSVVSAQVKPRDNDNTGVSNSVRFASPHQDRIVQPAPHTLAAQAERPILPLPYSHRPCATTSEPPTSTEAQRFAAIVMEIQQGSKEADFKTMMGRVVKRDGTIYGAYRNYKPEELIPHAQKYLNLVVEGQLKGSSLHFGDTNRPWLLVPRNDVPTLRAQLEEISVWERGSLPRSIPHVFFPLINLLSDTTVQARGLCYTQIHTRLLANGQHILRVKANGGKSSTWKGALHIDEFIKQAMTWCNLHVKKAAKGNEEDRFSLMYRNKPFKRDDHNDLYFGQTSSISSQLARNHTNGGGNPAGQAPSRTASNAIPLGPKRASQDDDKGEGSSRLQKKRR